MGRGLVLSALVAAWTTSRAASAVAAVNPSAASTVPDAPSSPTLTVLSGQDLKVDWDAPLTDGGQAIQSYNVEWDTDPGTQEVQTLTTTTNTGPNEVQMITTTSVDVNEIQLVQTTAVELREVQTIRTSANAGGALGGTFSVTLDMRSSGGTLQTSGEISHDAAATGAAYLSMKNVLEAMTNIGSGGIHDVTRTVDVAATGGYLWTITFASPLGNVPELKLADASALTGTGAKVDFNTVNDANMLDDTFRLSFAGFTTAAIPYDASVGAMASALQNLQSVESVDVTRSGPDNQRGFRWTVTFTSELNGGNVDQMVPVTTDLKGTGASAVVTTLTDEIGRAHV